MILVDTSAWFEWLIGSPTGETLAAHLPEQGTSASGNAGHRCQAAEGIAQAALKVVPVDAVGGVDASPSRSDDGRPLMRCVVLCQRGRVAKGMHQ